MLTSEDKWNPVCPNCGSDVEPTTTNDGTVFVCAQCDWNNTHARRKIQKQLFYGAGFVLVGVFLLLLGALSGSGMGNYIYFTAIAAAVWAATSWKPWKTLRKLDAGRSNPETESYSGFSCAPASFIALIPPSQEGQDLFGSVLSAPRPRPLTWLWLSRLGAAILLACIVFDVWMLSSTRGGSNSDMSGAFTVVFFSHSSQ
jgi:hypothetical protein